MGESATPRPNPIHILFKELEACPKCGSKKLTKIHDQKYPHEDGIIRVVIYRCHRGHESPPIRQLVVHQFNMPPIWK